MYQANQYEIVIIECCESCESHQAVIKHSEWKYYEHFNQLKKKIQRYVPNAIVIKNPIPDELHQPADIKLEKNIYINKNTQEKITFPRIGSFEVYIYNILLSSKLMTSTWPNHYKILQTLNKIIIAKKQGLSLDQFSIYNTQQAQVIQDKKQSIAINSGNTIKISSPNRRRIVSKKSKATNKDQTTTANRFRVYKSKQPKLATLDSSLNKKSTILNPLSRDEDRNKKFSTIVSPIQTQSNSQTQKPTSLRYIESKQQNRIKLPSLKNTINMLTELQNKKSVVEEFSLDQNRSKPIFNSIDGSIFDKDEMSMIERENDSVRLLNTSQNDIMLKEKNLSSNRFDDLNFYNNEDSILAVMRQTTYSPSQKEKQYLRRKYSYLSKNQKQSNVGSQNNLNNENFDQEEDDMRIVENRSIQYSERAKKEFMSRSIQYQQNEETINDFGVQIDDLSVPKEITDQFVQTEHVDIKQPDKGKQIPRLLDQATQVHIIIKKKQKHIEVQTFVPELIETEMNTDTKELVNRGYQFPDQDQQIQKKQEMIELDNTFVHLNEKRRNLPIDQAQTVYSIDRFQEKSTKYKWIGKAYDDIPFKELKRKLMLEALVFAVYNFFGIKTPEKRVAFVGCSNVIGEKNGAKNRVLYHVMSEENPEVQFFDQFEELNLKEKMFPLSEELTFRTSKQKVRFNNWGKFLALVYFLDDVSVFDNSSSSKKDHPQPQNSSLNHQQSSSLPQPLPPTYFSSMGLTITNEQVRQIHRMSCQNYQLFPSSSSTIHPTSKPSHPISNTSQPLIFLTSSRRDLYIDPNRLSKAVQLQFIAMLSRLCMETTFTELKGYLNEVFVDRSKGQGEKQRRLFESVRRYGRFEEEIKQEGASGSKDVKEIEEVDEITQILTAFISKLQNRLKQIHFTYRGKIHTYRKHNTLSPTITYSITPTTIIPRHLHLSYPTTPQSPQSREQKVQLDDVIKMLKTTTHMYFLSGEHGSGKTCFLNQVKEALEGEKENVVCVGDVGRVVGEGKRREVRGRLVEKGRNVLLVDNVNTERDGILLVSLIKTIASQRQDKYPISYMCVIRQPSSFPPLTLKLSPLMNKPLTRHQKFTLLTLLPLSDSDVNQYITKAIAYTTLTQKTALSHKILTSLDRTPCLRNPLYLSLYCRVIEGERLDEFIERYDPVRVTKWWVMRMVFERCGEGQREEVGEVGMEGREEKERIDVYKQLRQLVMRVHVVDKHPQTYSKDGDVMTFHELQQHKLQLIQQLFTQFEQDNEQPIKNHLQFYPIDMRFLVRMKTQSPHFTQEDNNRTDSIMERSQAQSSGIRLEELFVHEEFYQYMLAQAFTYYLTSGFRNLAITDIAHNPPILSLIRQKSAQDPSLRQQLLQLIYSTQTHPSLSQQASSAMTLLCHLTPQMSDLIFDHCQLGVCDVSMATFYNCSFRSANLTNATMYKTSFMHCAIDDARLDNINLLVRKYEIEWTPLCCAISKDGKQIVLGCGNYLVVVSAETGKELKKVEAHLDVIRSVRFSKDGRSLVTVGDDKTLRSWDATTFKSVIFKLPQKGGSVYYSTQSQTIATISNKTQLRVWNIKSMSSESLFTGHSDLITSVHFSHNGEYILTGSRDTTVRLWSLKGKQLHIYTGHSTQVTCARISPTNAVVASSSTHKDLIMYETLTETVINKRVFEQNEIVEICLDMKEEWVCCAFAMDERIAVMRFGTLEVVHRLQGHRQRVVSVGFDAGCERLVSLAKDRTVRVWELGRIMQKEMGVQKEIAIQQVYKQQRTAPGPALSIAYSQKLSQYATGHSNGSISIWCDHTNLILHSLTDHQGPVTKLCFDLSGKLYSGGKDGTLRIWNTQKRLHQQKSNQVAPLRRLQLFSVEMIELRINERNRVIVMSSANDQLVVYDLQGVRLVMSTREEGRVEAVGFDAKGRGMAVGGTLGVVGIYTVEQQYSQQQQQSPNTTTTQQAHNSTPTPTIHRTHQLGPHPQPITSLAYQGDSLLIAVLKTGHIYIWNHLKPALMKKIENMSPITCLSIYDQRYGCLASEDGKVRVVDFDEGREVKVFRCKGVCVGLGVRGEAGGRGVRGVRGEMTNGQTTSSSSSSTPLLYAACRDGNIIKWNLSDLSKRGQKLGCLPPLVAQQKKASSFGRSTVSEDGSVMVEIDGQRSIRVKNLNEHTQHVVTVDPKCPSTLQGVQFIDYSSSSQNHPNLLSHIILLLKSGQFWSIRTNSLYDPSSSATYNLLLGKDNMQGDLVYMKDREQVFFKSGVKRVSKMIRKPTQAVVEEVTIG